MNAYHVLAKVTIGIGQSATTEQRHYFVKASCPSNAVSLAESRTGVPAGTGTPSADIQYTVKEAQNRGSSGMESGEEIYSL